MRKWIAFTLAATFVLSVASCSSDDCPTCPTTGPPAPSLTYVGSSTCGTSGCHQPTYDMFIQSGHPYKLTAITGNQGPVFPWDGETTTPISQGVNLTRGAVVADDGPPPGTSWTDFAYVIGGYGWKARWVKPDGRVYTTTAQAQLNLWAGAGNPEWVAYHLGEDKKYDYSCFKCHTTGASETGSWPVGETDWGTFEFGGVQCEECHGRGSQHVTDPARFEMTVDSSPELCGRCHTRDPANRVAVSGGYIKHHEQYDEMIHSPHAAVGCGSCHDPHASVKYDAVSLGEGVTSECVDCHAGYDNFNAHVSIPNASPTCTDCHMPKAAKSARVSENPYIADISSHTFMINPAAVDKSTMWTSDGKFLNQDEFGRGRITLDFACYGCHKDDATTPTNPTAPWSARTLTELSTKATNIHAGVPVPLAKK